LFNLIYHDAIITPYAPAGFRGFCVERDLFTGFLGLPAGRT